MDNANTSYLATGVFSTVSQSKIFNCGYGIYLKGAPADSMDIHLVQTLLDHNGSNLYVITSGNVSEWERRTYMLAPAGLSGPQLTRFIITAHLSTLMGGRSPRHPVARRFTSSNGKTFINGRFSGAAEGQTPLLMGTLSLTLG